MTKYPSNVAWTRITSFSLSAGRSVTVRLTGVLINSYGGKNTPLYAVLPCFAISREVIPVLNEDFTVCSGEGNFFRQSSLVSSLFNHFTYVMYPFACHLANMYGVIGYYNEEEFLKCESYHLSIVF